MRQALFLLGISYNFIKGFTTNREGEVLKDEK